MLDRALSWSSFPSSALRQLIVASFVEGHASSRIRRLFVPDTEYRNDVDSEASQYLIAKTSACIYLSEQNKPITIMSSNQATGSQA